MYRSELSPRLEFDHGFKTVPLCFSTFYLNRYSFKVKETDDVLGTPDENNFNYGFEDLTSVNNLSNSFRYSHGVTFAVLGSGSLVKINDYKKPGIVPRSRIYIAGEDTSYKYYISSVGSSGTPTLGKGYLASRGTYLGRPQIEYFDEQGNNHCLPGNSVVIKWNTVNSKPTYYKIWIKSRPIDTLDAPTWKNIYNTAEDGLVPLRTAERYGVSHIINSDERITRIYLAKLDETKSPLIVTPAMTGHTVGLRRSWVNGDYLDFDKGDDSFIRNVDNSINGTAKIVNVNKQEGWIEVESSFPIDQSFDIADKNIEIYSLEPGIQTFYLQDDESWSTRENYWSEINQNLVDICGVRVEILGIDQRSSRAELIEICPALSADFTSFVKSVEFNEELSERSVSIPIGTVSANSGSIVLSNSTNLFDITNSRRKVRPNKWAGSFFSKMLDDGVEFRLYSQITSLQTGESTIVPMCPMISDTWTSTPESATVSLLDYSKFLQDRQAPDLLLNNYPITSIIYILLDKCGFSRILPWHENYSVAESEPIIEWFWCKKEDSVWQVLQQLATSTQTSIFFDRHGYLKILTLPVMSTATRGESGKNIWKARAVSTSNNDLTYLSNIFSFDRQASLAANKVNVKYHPAVVKGVMGEVAQSVFWVAPDNYSMGVALLSGDISPSDTTMTFITNGDPPFPRFKSSAALKGNNIVTYDAMEARLQNLSNQKRWIESQSDYLKSQIDNKGQYPPYTGKVRLLSDQKERLTAFDMSGDAGFTFRQIFAGSSKRTRSASAFKSYDPSGQCWMINAPKDNSFIDVNKMHNKAFESVAIKFNVSGNAMNKSPRTFCGISLYHQTLRGNETMYLIGCFLGEDKSLPGKEAAVRACRVSEKGSIEWLPKISNKDKHVDLGLPIVAEMWNWLETKIIADADGNTFEVFLNGILIGRFRDSKKSAGKPLIRNTNAGFFCQNGTLKVDRFIVMDIPKFSPSKKKTKASIKAANHEIEMSDISYYTKSAVKKSKKKKYHLKWSEVDAIYDQYIKQIKTRQGANLFFYEFTNTVKEYIEEKNIRFEKGPALTAQLVSTNPNVSIDSFTYSPFGANFRIRNNSGEQQLLSGSRNIGDVADGSREEVLHITGNSLVQTDAQITITSKDLGQRLGDKKLEVDAVWIQSYSQAIQLGKWIIENQGDGAEIYSLKIFGNSFIDIGDIFEIEYAEKGLLSDKKFVVVSITNSFEKGHETSLVLRKISPKPNQIMQPDLDIQT